jgi:hypothetical protein
LRIQDTLNRAGQLGGKECRLLKLEGIYQLGDPDNERRREVGVDDLGDKQSWMRF